MASLELRECDIEIVDRVRYHKKTRRAVHVLKEHNATCRTNAVRSSEVGLVTSPWTWWLTRRGVIRRTGSGKYWLDTARQDQLAAGAPIRMAFYLAVAGVFSGASMAMAAAGF
ncbi:MAG: hypothetical protein Phyf2KO_09680 [Phycisphaerales bacterium]